MLAFMITLRLETVSTSCCSTLGRRAVIPCHGQSSLLGIVACERHPCDVEWMRESAKSLRPYYAEVAHPTEVDVSEDAVEDVAEQVAEEPKHNGFASSVT